MTELCYLSIAEALLLIRKGELSPVELTRAHLERIEQLDPKLHSYITVAPAVALRQAKQAIPKKHEKPLCGIPVSYKDLIATAGIRTTAASRVLEHWVPDKDAHVVTRLRERGAVTLGKATLNEFAFSSGDPEEEFFVPARNPWNLNARTGLSSSGSAAGVAAGLAMASIATDSGGSIRMPASYCGVTGLKPTWPDWAFRGRTAELLLRSCWGDYTVSRGLGHLVCRARWAGPCRSCQLRNERARQR